jgi:hypothetical protein
VFGMTLADYAALKTRSDAGKPRKRKRWGRSRTPVERELIQSGPQCHPAIMPARICNEINGLQVPKTGAKSPQENASTASYGV